MCEGCGKRIEQITNNQKMCKKCFDQNRREYKTKKQREYRNSVDIQK